MEHHFSSRDVARLLDDVNAAIVDVQSVRSPASKAMRALDILHCRGWKVVAAEPMEASVEVVAPEPPPPQLFGLPAVIP